MWITTARDALANGRRLELRYDGRQRLVEVHIVGQTRDGHPIMLAWQVSGDSRSSKPQGWKLMRLDQVESAHLTDQNSGAPRPGYTGRSPGIETVECRVEPVA